MRLLVTGGAGFIGSNFVRYWVAEHPEDSIVVLDALTYAGNRSSLEPLEETAGVGFVVGDIADQPLVEQPAAHRADHDDREFRGRVPQQPRRARPGALFPDERARHAGAVRRGPRVGVERLHHISTCEVYGDLALDSDESFTEQSPYRPRTPYNASKAGSDHVVRCYGETFGLPVTITNCCNNYGPYQFPEKVIPLFATRAIGGEPLPLYASVANRREWLHVADHCRAIDAVLRHGRRARPTTWAPASRPPSRRSPTACSPPRGRRRR